MHNNRLHTLQIYQFYPIYSEAGNITEECQKYGSFGLHVKWLHHTGHLYQAGISFHRGPNNALCGPVKRAAYGDLTTLNYLFYILD